MNLIDQQFEKIKKEKRMGLMTHVVIGYPSLDETVKIVKAMAEVGVDFVELQIPFSDPLVDGPTIMKACENALENGFKVKDAFTVMNILSQQVSIPLLFMGYYNTVFKYGVEKFCKDARKAGASGLIIPDIPIDEESEEHFLKYAKENNIYTIRVVSPASTPERLKKNAEIAEGFVYCTARQGITGARKELDPNLAEYLKRVRKIFSVPIAVGFGISKREHIDALGPFADTAIIGSALINVINSSKKDEIEENVKKFIKFIML